MLLFVLKIVWAVWRTNGETVGPANPVPFNYVDQNVGNAWQTASNTVVIPPSGNGTYYVHLIASTCSTLVKGFEITLNLNGVTVFTIYHYIASSYAPTAREQATILNLVSGDILSTSIPDYACINGGDGKQTAFNGFRLA